MGLVLFFSQHLYAAPHWTHEEQQEWGAIEEVGEPIPLNYPFAVCGIGIRQSPVDLAGAEFDVHINNLITHYPVDKPDFYNSGHAIQVNKSLDYSGYLKIGHERFPLIQFHFHTPSEHVIDAQVFDAELHFVHVRNDGRLAVLGILIQEGKTNETLQTILDNMPHEEGTTNSGSMVSINPSKLLPHNRKHVFTYAGSLTTPPCSEGINWYVMTEPITASIDQIEMLEYFYHDNARHAQDLNGRAVKTNQ